LKAFVAIALWITLLTAAFAFSGVSYAQLSPFPEEDGQSGSARDLPEILPSDLSDPVVNPRQTSADRMARLFNRDLRDLEEAQRGIIEQLEALPAAARETQRVSDFGYHSGSLKKRPKWIQIDMGEPVSPDAIALFPVTAEIDGSRVFGYGFPRNFRVDISNEKEFRNYETMVESRVDDPNAVQRWPFFREVPAGFTGRYIRITATAMWRDQQSKRQVFALSEAMILKRGRNLAVGKLVEALDSEDRGNQWSPRFLCDGITTLGIPLGLESSPTLGFKAKSKKPVKDSWVQVDLGEEMKIDEVQIILADSLDAVPDPTVRFPYPMEIQVSSSPDMSEAETLGRFNPSRISMIGENPLILTSNDVYGRYVRITVLGPAKGGNIAFNLAELVIFSGSGNVALGKTVSAMHQENSERWAPQFLVDGFGSRRNLVSSEAWLSSISKRSSLARRWWELESKRLNLVDRTVTRGVTVAGSGVAGTLGFVLIALSRGRVRRRKDLEDLRQRIASDLHDDIGSNLSSIALLAELGKTETDEPELVVEELTEIKLTADKTIESMRDIVWLIRPGEETWQQMLTRFRETASKLLRAHEYSLEVRGESTDMRLPLEFKRDLFLIYKEVLNNIVRHAEANNVLILIDCRRNRLEMLIEDNGRGFNNLDQEFREGNGLRNLRMRAQAIGANLKVRSALSEGTRINITVPMP
tara:strand:+ start:237 stop:2330 length:2094 start_codon:yes stop_codon:yes gene_type:complete